VCPHLRVSQILGLHKQGSVLLLLCVFSLLNERNTPRKKEEKKREKNAKNPKNSEGKKMPLVLFMSLLRMVALQLWGHALVKRACIWESLYIRETDGGAMRLSREPLHERART
jgi:hypothetical protein